MTPEQAALADIFIRQADTRRQAVGIGPSSRRRKTGLRCGILRRIDQGLTLVRYCAMLDLAVSMGDKERLYPPVAAKRALGRR